MKGWYKRSGVILHELETTNNIYLPNQDITELVIPNGVEKVYCVNNKLTELVVPDSVTQISCSGNNLTELLVPDNCFVTCDHKCVVITRTELRSKRLKYLLSK
jgi:hypothetical protein